MIYKLKNKEAPWGDYGDILVAGMTAHLGRRDGLLQLERTAPYVPPLIISGIWDVIVTDSTKIKLERSELTGISFRKVIKKHIVKLNWTTWDLNAEEPAFYPDSGEPEDYVLADIHSESAAQKLGQLWEVVVPTTGTFDPVGNYTKGDTSFDIFRADNRGSILMTEKAKEWIEKNAGDWVVFEKL